jgi:hypothetical protein
MKRKSRGIAVLFAPLLLAASLPAAAITIYSWNSGNCASGSTLQTSCTDTATVPAGGGTVTYSAISDSGPTVSSQKTLAAAYVGNYNPNLGVTTRAGPNNASGGTGSDETLAAPDHAMDNNGNSEFLLLSFANAVSLRDVQLGYESGDSDLTVLAYTGAGVPTLAGMAYNGLVAAGWQFIGNYSDAYDTTTTVSGFGSQGSTVAINAGGVNSSYWLIGAYNSTWGATNSGTVGTLSAGNDYVKLLAAYGCVSGPGASQCGGGGGGGQQVPEPSTVLLMGAALLGFSRLHRRRKA